MARGATAAARWSDYHPEVEKLSNVKGRQAKANIIRGGHDVPNSFESPESSSIASAHYDPETETLSVHFKRGKTIARYDYPKVPAGVWAEFAQADSKGTFFGARIRPLYEGTRIERT